MIAGGEGTCSVCVCAENMFIVCCDHRLIRLHSFDMHGKEGKKVGFISVLPKKFLPVVWHTNIPCNHSPDALASLGPSTCFQAVVLVCIYINIYQLYQLGRPSSAGIPHMEIFSSGRNHWRFYNLLGVSCSRSLPHPELYNHILEPVFGYQLHSLNSWGDQPFYGCAGSRFEIAMAGSSDFHVWKTLPDPLACWQAMYRREKSAQSFFKCETFWDSFDVCRTGRLLKMRNLFFLIGWDIGWSPLRRIVR